MSIYDVGYRAFFHGKPLSNNPFAVDNLDHERWSRGWEIAREDQLEHGIELDYTIDPRDLGYLAYLDGRSMRENPWTIDTVPGQDWMTGWNDGLYFADEVCHEHASMS